MKSNGTLSKAEKWDEWNNSGGPNYPHEKVVQFCLRKFAYDVRRRTRTLDLGCGTGINTWFLCREGFQVTATDISQRAIEASKNRLEKSCLAAELRVESADEIDEPDESFELIICVGVLEATGPQISKKIFEECRRVLTAKGTGFFIFASDEDYRVGSATPYNLYGYSYDEIGDMLPNFGSVMFDRYVTTYENGALTQSDWILTCRK